VILLSAVGVGLLIGIGKARWQGQIYRLPPLKFFWLVALAYLPQLLLLALTRKQVVVPVETAGIMLVISLGMLMVFVWLNRHLPGMPILLGGLIMNLAVIAANGGLMPISPQTASQLVSGEARPALEPGGRFGEKDVLLPEQEMRLEFLSDRYLLPAWFPYKAAFSLGDALVGAGALWFLVANQREER